MASIRDAVIPYIPDIDSSLEKLIGGTGLLQGGWSDYAFSMLIALLFPIVRYILDKTAFDVSK